MFSNGPHEGRPTEPSRVIQRMGTVFSESLAGVRRAWAWEKCPQCRIILEEDLAVVAVLGHSGMPSKAPQAVRFLVILSALPH